MEYAKSVLAMLVRYAISIVGGILVSQGLADPTTSENFVIGVSGVIVAIVWALITKYFDVSNVDKALTLPENSTREDL
jgi:hypothetical protein